MFVMVNILGEVAVTGWLPKKGYEIMKKQINRQARYSIWSSVWGWLGSAA